MILYVLLGPFLSFSFPSQANMQVRVRFSLTQGQVSSTRIFLVSPTVGTTPTRTLKTIESQKEGKISVAPLPLILPFLALILPVPACFSFLFHFVSFLPHSINLPCPTLTYQPRENTTHLLAGGYCCSPFVAVSQLLPIGRPCLPPL